MSTAPTALGLDLDLPRSIQAPAATELALANQSLASREHLLAAAARASRLLLEAPEAMKIMPQVLKLLGEAAEVDRVALALAEIDLSGERWLVIKDEWIAEDLKGMCSKDEPCPLGPDQYSDVHCTMLQSGKSVLFCRDSISAHAGSITSDLARSSAIVPILVDGEYVGVIGFDDWRRTRQFDSSIVSALEIAAGLVGAALHRERLVEIMRREREHAAEERLARLAEANNKLRANFVRLSRNPDPGDFIANMLIDATRQLEAAAAYAAGWDAANNQWRVFVHVEDERVCEPPFQVTVGKDETRVAEVLAQFREPVFYELDPLDRIVWPGVAQWHERAGHKSAYLLPLVFDDTSVGFIALMFRQKEALSAERAEVALTIAHQATLAIGMKKLGMAAKEAAVLAERNRIGQEIHDGLAQGFTGILMQLGAAEESLGACAKDSPLSDMLARIRALAREGLSEARRSVLALRPDQTRRIGLELALRALVERSHLPGRVNFSFEGGMSGDGLAPEHQHELLRIAQEAVSNAVRHANPGNVRISLGEDELRWLLTVSDDGRGMTLLPELYAAQGFGLTNMRERAGAIGGQFEIDSKPGAGTRVIVSIPRPVNR